MRILATDIETAPNTVHVWGLFNQNVGTNQILNTGRVMCLAAKWIGARSPILFYGEHWIPHEEVIREAHKLLDEADVVVTYNGDRFDLPTLNREFVKYGLAPPSPYVSVDLIRTAKRRFRFVSNKLDHISGELGIGRKRKHEGHELWVKCMNGDPLAWDRMKRYNIQDVRLLERLYQRVRPWIKTHPNPVLYNELLPDDPMCPRCGSKKLQRRGTLPTRVVVYQRYQCQSCGTWSRSRKGQTSDGVLVT